MASTAIATPQFLQYFIPGTNQPAVNYRLFTYQAGTSTKQVTYTSIGGPANSNPIILDANGIAQVVLDPTLLYKYVWAPPGIDDPPTSPIYTADNISPFVPYNVLSALVVPNSITPVEATAATTYGITINTSYPYGDVRRYGADPTGAMDSSPSFAAAITSNSYVFDGQPGGGSYIFNSTCLIWTGTAGRYPVHITGAVKNIGNGTGGTTITLQAVAGAGASIFSTTAFATGIKIENIGFFFQNGTIAQNGFFANSDLRASTISDCAFYNTASGTNITGIKLLNATTYTGAVSIRDNYMTGMLYGINLGGPCTTVRIRDNELYGNVTGSQYGILIGSQVSGVSIFGNTLEGWNIGIQNNGKSVVQVGNYFQGNTTADFDWSAGAPNSFSIADNYTGGASPVALLTAPNNATGNSVIGGSYGAALDSQSLTAYRGFNELGLTPNLGYGTTATPTVTANGGGAISGLTTTTFSYSRVGGMMTVSFNLAMTLTGASTTQINITVPQSLTVAATTSAGVGVLNNAATAAGLATASGTNIAIALLPAGNWTAGSIQVNGQIALRIIS